MTAIDDFATTLLEEAKRFLEKANESTDEIAATAFLHAGLMLGFCGLEAHINSVADEVALRPELNLHEQGLLLEKEVRLENGEFKLGALKISRLEDRILYLHHRFSGAHLDKSDDWWGNLRTAIGLRNSITHPKNAAIICTVDVERALDAIIQTINVVYLAVFNRPFPYGSLGLHSRLSF
jgi:hypothetical protein